MPDMIRFTQRVVGRLTSRRLFQFTPERWGRERIEPYKLREWQTRLSYLFGTRLFARTYPGITGRVHIHDSMLQNDSPEEIAHYISVGQSAMTNIEESLVLAGREFGDIQTCLDMACGYGRVLRLLAQKIEPRRITACEIEEEAVRFLAEEFGVHPVVSQYDFRRIQFPATYDLIWVGSLFTHLEPTRVGLEMLDMLIGLLNVGGLLSFSTQGASCLEHIPFYGFMFVEREAMYREDMASKGFAYWPYYPHTPDYGIAMYREDYLRDYLAAKYGARLKLVRFKERGWDKHQDVWTVQRIA